MEIWRDIKGYEGLYQVSNKGRVKALKRTWKCGKNGCTTRTSDECIMSLCNGTKGYKIIRLQSNGKRETLKVHRLVAEAFIPNPNNLPQVNHKDECKSNNFVENLEWCDNKYNVNYGTSIDRMRNKMINGKTSKTVYQYTLDGELVAIYPSTAEAKRQNPTYSQGNIIGCCGNRYGRKTYKGYKWSYEPL
jgi:hypothetical protein